MLEPLQDEFMRRAIAEIALIGLASGALGCWIVLYEFSYAAESLAHSLFPGLVIAALTGIPLLLGATPAILLAALAIALAARAPGTSRDVAVAVVITTMFGLGVLLALSPDSPPGIEALLFGDILGPSDSDLIAAAAMAVAIPAALWALHPRLLLSGFDHDAARALGVSAGRIEAILLVLLAAAAVVSVQGLGNLLVVAVLVGPAATARQLTDRIVPMLFLAAAIAVLAGIAGLYASYYLSTAGGASVALAMFAAYLLALPIGRLRAWRGSPEPAEPEATIA
jgi:ABC-type Mn2+/Zn2+ transport system permease subunit